MKTYQILSIDAWREGRGWEWNNWFTVGHIEKIPASNRAIAKLMRDEGYLLETSKGKIRVTDDQYTIVIEEKSNGRPLFAIEYGGACMTWIIKDLAGTTCFQGISFPSFEDGEYWLCEKLGDSYTEDRQEYYIQPTE